MRDFLKDLYIVGATLAFREGKLIKYCLRDLKKYCDYIVVVLDNYDRKTEKVVLSYKNKYPNLFTVAYSGVGLFKGKALLKRASLKRRLNAKQDKIRGRVLEEVKKINEKRKIDLLIFPDGDEVFTKYFPKVLKAFWEMEKKKVLFLKPSTVFDSFKIMKRRTLASHAKVYKYRDDMSTTPYRFRGFYQPFKMGTGIKRKFYMVHLPFLTKKMMEFRKHYTGRTIGGGEDLWELEKDIRDMCPSEVIKTRRKPPSFTVAEYYKKKYGKNYSE